MREKGKIEKREKNIDYGQRNSKKYLSSIEGTIISEGQSYSFKYNELKFDVFLVQIGLNVSFDLSTNSSGKKVVENIDKEPTQYGFLSSHNEQVRGGIFRVSEYSDGVVFFDFNVRNGDTPIYNSVYQFDIITPENSMYFNSHYVIGEESDSDDFEVGQIRNGKIVAVEEYGAFVDIGYPNRDALLHVQEIIWSKERVASSDLLSKGNEIRVLITDIHEDGNKINIAVSAKALLNPPIEPRAVNIFRVNQMNSRIISTIVEDIVQRDDILSEIKIGAIHIIKSHPELYQNHKDSTIPLLYGHCKKEFLTHIENEKYREAFSLFQEYATYDNKIFNDLNKFPDYFLSELKSIDISIE
jgi:predicted RNA-binding protein with RPS1 domain